MTKTNENETDKSNFYTDASVEDYDDEDDLKEGIINVVKTLEKS